LPAPKFVAWCSIQLSYGRVGPRIIWKGSRSVNLSDDDDGRHATERKTVPRLAPARRARHRHRLARARQRARPFPRTEVVPNRGVEGITGAARATRRASRTSNGGPLPHG